MAVAQHVLVPVSRDAGDVLTELQARVQLRETVTAFRALTAADPWGAPPVGRVPAPDPGCTRSHPRPRSCCGGAGAGAADPWAPPASTDAKRSWGPLTEGLNVPRDLDLGYRAKALEQFGVNWLAHAAIVGVVKDVLPETQVGLLVGSRQWPRLAHRMDQIRDQGGTGLLAAHLARLGIDATWKDDPSSTTVGRLVDATLHSRRHRPPPRPRLCPG
ncbi:hypothetical protein [Streptomyces sp. NPDC054883]